MAEQVRSLSFLPSYLQAASKKEGDVWLRKDQQENPVNYAKACRRIGSKPHQDILAWGEALSDIDDPDLRFYHFPDEDKHESKQPELQPGLKKVKTEPDLLRLLTHNTRENDQSEADEVKTPEAAPGLFRLPNLRENTGGRSSFSRTFKIRSRGSIMANNNNMFPSFLDTTNVSPGTGLARQTASPGPQVANPQFNGNIANANILAPLPAGHQSDIEHVYSLVLELSAQLKQNREMTAGIVRDAEEVMRRYNSSGAQPSINEVGEEFTVGRVRELERELAKKNAVIESLKHHEVEDLKLLQQYEDAVGTMTAQISEYCSNNTMHYLAQTRHYNNLLQKEKDDHLQSRLEKDEWHAKCLKVCGMITHANKLANEEFADHIRVISGLQSEVRILRNVIGLDKQKPEEETGWEFLKEVPLDIEGIDET